MKNLLFILILIFYSSFLFSQVNFELDFNFEKIDPDDNMINLQLFDYNSDGIDEIILHYANHSEHIYKLVCYNQSGEIVDSIFIQRNNNEVIKQACLNQYDLNLYIPFISFNSNDGLFFYIYDITESSIIDSLYLDIFGFFENPECFNFLHAEQINDEVVYYTGISIFLPFYSTAILSKVCFTGFELSFIEMHESSGLDLNKFQDYSDLVISGFQLWDDEGYANKISKLFTVTNEMYSDFQLQFSVSGSLVNFPTYTIYNNWPGDIITLNKNDWNFQVYGHVIGMNIYDTSSGNFAAYKCFAPDFSSTLWNSGQSQIGLDPISSSTCIPVNYEDHYVMYFRGDQLEIRDRINGNIIHYQNSSISPFAIKRKSDGELLFFVEQEDETGYDVYVLDGEIQVSVDNNQLQITNYKLQNYPNPFNPETEIVFSIAGSDDREKNVSITIYNIKGQKVKTLVDKVMIPGRYSIIWNSKDQNDKPVSSGIYFYQLKLDGEVKKTKKMMLIK